MQIKEIFVVVEGRTVWVKGSNLKISDTPADGGKILIIVDTVDTKPMTIAVFKQWDYWAIKNRTEGECRHLRDCLDEIHKFIHEEKYKRFHNNEIIKQIDAILDNSLYL